MWRRARAAAAALTLAVSVVLLTAGAAAAAELRLAPASGPPGTEFTVTGSGFAAADVEIHWGGQSGPVIATATGPTFSVSAVVPDSPPNSQSVVAVVRDGGAVSTSSASFQVTEGTRTTTEPQVTTETTAVPAPARSSGAAAGVPRGGTAVDGGLDPSMAETTTGVGATDRPAGGGPNLPAASNAATAPTGAGAAAGGGAAPVAGAAGATGVAGVPGATGAPETGTPGDPAAPGARSTGIDAPRRAGAQATGAALGQKPTSQSSRGLSSPILLVVGAGMVFGGGIVLAVRNRDRVSS